MPHRAAPFEPAPRETPLADRPPGGDEAIGQILEE